jgi:hypothetical protein
MAVLAKYWIRRDSVVLTKLNSGVLEELIDRLLSWSPN